MKRGAGQVRIIGGRMRGRRLMVPEVPGLRPTPDRVRETLFNWLAPYIGGMRVLDLYAGSGALGLEAASRGAAAVTLVEKGTAAVQVCRRNAAAVARAAPPSARPEIMVRAASVQSFLTGAAGPYDLVFLDPPYDVDDDELLTALTALRPLLADEAIVCVERSTRSGEPTLPSGLVVE